MMFAGIGGLYSMRSCKGQSMLVPSHQEEIWESKPEGIVRKHIPCRAFPQGQIDSRPNDEVGNYSNKEPTDTREIWIKAAAINMIGI